jgi:Fe-Mn family superoxide dismutase
MYIAANSINLTRISSQKENDFEFIKLPYSFDFLEPVIDAETMKIHHTKHQKKYFDNMMDVLNKFPKLKKDNLIDLMSNLDKIPNDQREAFKNNAGGYYNHTFFWNCMTSKNSKYQGSIKKLIDKEFGSLDKFQEAFVEIGLKQFGSGWVWLYSKNGNSLKLESMPNQINPYIENKGIPILGCDIWEHAYYLKYQNDRETYLNKWFSIINWDFVNESLENI